MQTVMQMATTIKPTGQINWFLTKYLTTKNKSNIMVHVPLHSKKYLQAQTTSCLCSIK